MTNEKAIEILQTYRVVAYHDGEDDTVEALDIAIKAIRRVKTDTHQIGRDGWEIAMQRLQRKFEGGLV